MILARIGWVVVVAIACRAELARVNPCDLEGDFDADACIPEPARTADAAQPPGRPCLSDQQCVAGARCDRESHTCVAACQTDDDCVGAEGLCARARHVCRLVCDPAQRICRAGCTADADCAGDQTCAATRACAARHGPQMAAAPWPALGRDMRRTGASEVAGAQRGWLKWARSTGAAVRASPVIGADGTVYVGSSDGHLYALRGEDGVVTWAAPTEGAIEAAAALGADGTVYVGDAAGVLYALGPDGTEQWRVTTGGPILTAPAIAAGGRIFVGGGDNRLIAVDPSGRVAWTLHTGGLRVSTPAILPDGRVVVSANGAVDTGCGLHCGLVEPPYAPEHANVLAVTPEGGLSWTWHADFRASRYGAPSVDADGTVYLAVDAPLDYVGVALESDGTLRETFRGILHNDNPSLSGFGAGNTLPAPAIGPDGRLRFWLGREAFLIDPRAADAVGGQRRLSDERPLAPPVVGAAGNTFFGGSNGMFYAVHPEWRVLWNLRLYPDATEDATGPAVTAAAAIAADGTLIFGAADGNVYAVGP